MFDIFLKTRALWASFDFYAVFATKIQISFLSYKNMNFCAQNEGCKQHFVQNLFLEKLAFLPTLRSW